MRGLGVDTHLLLRARAGRSSMAQMSIPSCRPAMGIEVADGGCWRCRSTDHPKSAPRFGRCKTPPKLQDPRPSLPVCPCRPTHVAEAPGPAGAPATLWLDSDIEWARNPKLFRPPWQFPFIASLQTALNSLRRIKSSQLAISRRA